MFCGAGSFSHVDEDPSSPPTPRGPRRKQQDGGNPYSARGLEKFTMVLADLEARREKIMAKAGSQGVAVVRFVYSNTQDWVPVVVRRREKQRRGPEEEPEGGGGEEGQKKPADAAAGDQQSEQTGTGAAIPAASRAVDRRFSWTHGVGEGARGTGLRSLLRWKDSYYWPAAAVLILLCLATFGRVFAICCTSVWWYMAPVVGRGGEGRRVRRSMKKEYGLRMSDRRLGGGGGGGEGGVASAQAKRAGGAVEEPASPRDHAAAKRG